MAKLMCKYDRVYDLEAHYTDKWTFKLEYHFIRGLCDGIDAVVPEDQLIYEGHYKTPQGEWTRVTPIPQK